MAIGTDGRVVDGNHAWLLTDPDSMADVLANVVDVRVAEHRTSANTSRVEALREILAHVRKHDPKTDAGFVAELSPRLRAVEDEVRGKWFDLRARMVAAVESEHHDARTVGYDMTPLQNATPEVSFVG